MADRKRKYLLPATSSASASHNNLAQFKDHPAFEFWVRANVTYVRSFASTLFTDSTRRDLAQPSTQTKQTNQQTGK